MRKMNLLVNFVVSAAVFILISGCAGTAPDVGISQRIAPESEIAAKDEAKVTVNTGANVSMLESEKTRLGEKIGYGIDTRKTKNIRDGAAKTYEVDLTITKYEKGNAFARSMLAGLGQIHINGEITVFAMPGRTTAGKFSISKTFAWGGIYGGTTNIEDIETTFADGVAAVVTGQTDEPK